MDLCIAQQNDLREEPGLRPCRFEEKVAYFEGSALVQVQKIINIGMPQRNHDAEYDSDEGERDED